MSFRIKYVARFVWNLFKALLLTNTVTFSFLKIMLVVMTILLAYNGLPKVDDAIRLVALRQAERWHEQDITISQVIGFLLVFAWFSGCVGYTYATTSMIELSIDDVLYADPPNKHFRVKVSSVNIRPVKARVDVERVMLPDGQLSNVSMHLPRQVQWTLATEPEISKDTPEILGPLYVMNNMLHIDTGVKNRMIPIEESASPNAEIWIELAAKAPHEIADRKWFVLRKDSSQPLGFTAASGNPPFLQKKTWWNRCKTFISRVATPCQKPQSL